MNDIMTQAGSEPRTKENQLPDNHDLTSPKIVIYRCIDFRETAAGKYELFYTNHHERPHPAKLKDFLESKKPYPLPVPGDTNFATADGAQLDLNCSQDCYIVFYLNDDRNWQFATSGGGVSMKSIYGDRYSQLTYVHSDGSETKDRPRDGCKLLHFRAKGKDEEYKHGFNLKIELLLPGGSKREVLIDPDIRNPGGSGSIA